MNIPKRKRLSMKETVVRVSSLQPWRKQRNQRGSALKAKSLPFTMKDSRFALDSRTALKAFRLIGGFDGIEIEELRKVVNTVSDSQVREPLQRNMANIFAQFDTDDNGVLDAVEFESMIQNSTILQQAVYELLEKAEDEERNEYLIAEPYRDFGARPSSINNAIEIASLVLTLLYVVVLVIQLDCAPTWIGWSVFEMLFLVAFSVELSIRFWRLLEQCHNGTFSKSVLDITWRFLRAPTTVFDILIIVGGFIEVVLTLHTNQNEVSALRWIRFLRVCRCARLLRVFWYCTELMLVIKGILSGMRSAIWGFALISWLVFIWAIILRTAVENDWLQDSSNISSLSNTPDSVVMVFRCMALSADSACSEKPKEFGWAFDFLWGLSETFVLVGILNVVTSIYVIRAEENASKVLQSINYATYRQDTMRLQKLDKLLRTLIHPGREHSNPKDRNAAEVATLLRTQHPEAAAKLPNLEMQIVHFAQHIQDARKLHQSAMDTYEAQEVQECKILRSIPFASTYMVNGIESLLVADVACANNPLLLPMAPVGGLQVVQYQNSGDMVVLLEEAREVQQFVKSLIYPKSAWASQLGSGHSGDIWKKSKGLCDEAIDPGLKSPERIEQKVHAKYAGRYERNRDYSRLSLIYDSVLHMINAIPRFLEYDLDTENVQVVTLENRFLEPHRLGWRDITLLLKVGVPSTLGHASPSYHIMEVQMRLRRMEEINKEGHKFYEDIRASLPEDLVLTILDRLVTDTTLDLGITKAEWLQCLPNPEIKQILDDLGIPRRSRKALFDIIDIDGSGTVTSSELQEILLLVKDPVQKHEMMGCHFRVRDVQRLLQTKIEPQLLQMYDFIWKSMEESTSMLEEVCHTIGGLDKSPGNSPGNNGPKARRKSHIPRREFSSQYGKFVVYSSYGKTDSNASAADSNASVANSSYGKPLKFDGLPISSVSTLLDGTQSEVVHVASTSQHTLQPLVEDVLINLSRTPRGIAPPTQKQKAIPSTPRAQ